MRSTEVIISNLNEKFESINSLRNVQNPCYQKSKSTAENIDAANETATGPYFL